MDAAVERTWTYSQRVLAARTGPAAPQMSLTDHGCRRPCRGERAPAACARGRGAV